MLDAFKRKLAAGALTSLLKSLATNKDTQTSVTGMIAAAVLAVPGLDMTKLVAGDPSQIAHLAAALLVALIGYFATKANADGKTTLIGAVAGSLYAASGSVGSIATGAVIAALGYFTNKPVGAPLTSPADSVQGVRTPPAGPISTGG